MWSGNLSRVAMMKSTNHRDRDDITLRTLFDIARYRRVAIQRKMRASVALILAPLSARPYPPNSRPSDGPWDCVGLGWYSDTNQESTAGPTGFWHVLDRLLNADRGLPSSSVWTNLQTSEFTARS